MNRQAQQRVTELLQDAVDSLATAAKHCEHAKEYDYGHRIADERRRVAELRAHFFLKTFQPPSAALQEVAR